MADGLSGAEAAVERIRRRVSPSLETVRGQLRARLLSSTFVVSAVAVLCAAVLALIGWNVLLARAASETAASRAAETLAGFAGREAEADVAAADTFLRGLIAVLPVSGPVQLTASQYAVLSVVAGEDGRLGAVVVLDAGARPLHLIAPPDGPVAWPDAGFAAAPWFTEALRQPSRLVVGPPSDGLARPQPVLPIARAISGPDGVRGVVMAELLVESIEGSLADLDLGPEGVVWLLWGEETVVFRQPPADDPGESSRGMSSLPHVRHAIGSSKDADRGMTTVDRGARLYAVRALADAPLIIAVGIAELELATGMTLTSQSRAMLESGGAVAVFDEYVVDGEIRIDWQDPLEVLMPTSPTGEVPVERSDTLPAVVQKPPAPVQAGILLLPETARELGLDVEPMALMVQLDEAPGFVQSDAVRAISVDRTGSEWGIPTYIETGPTDAVGPSAWALLAVSGVIAITASTVAVGLSRIDGRRDSAILGAVGATPRLRRAIGFWQVLVLAGLGSLVGSVLGVAAAGALALPGGPLPFAPPWMQLLLSTVAVPLAIAIGAWLFPGRQNALPTDRSAIA